MEKATVFGKTVGQSIAPIVDLIFPPRCPLCGTSTADQGGLCASCWSGLVIPSEPACARCSRPFPADVQTNDTVECAACLAKPPIHSGIYAATIYNEVSRKLILTFKHGRKIALAPHLARLMAAKLPAGAGTGLDKPPILIPVPLHRWRMWRRGYNQSALLAQELEKLGKGVALLNGLVRSRHTPMLGGMRRAERERALRGAIKVSGKISGKNRAILRGREVILIDDVLTSGATSDACTKILLKAGAKSVSIACFARVMNEALHGDQSAI